MGEGEGESFFRQGEAEVADWLRQDFFQKQSTNWSREKGRATEAAEEGTGHGLITYEEVKRAGRNRRGRGKGGAGERILPLEGGMKVSKPGAFHRESFYRFWGRAMINLYARYISRSRVLGRAAGKRFERGKMENLPKKAIIERIS